jgi:hypothetical protein
VNSHVVYMCASSVPTTCHLSNTFFRNSFHYAPEAFAMLPVPFGMASLVPNGRTIRRR